MPSQDARLLALIERFHDLRQAGQAMSVEELCASCPELIGELRRHLDACDKLGRLADSVWPETQSPDALTGIWGGEPLHGRREPTPTVAGYEDLAWVGAGGMGAVFRARHVRLDRTVALKLVRAEELTSSALARLQAEARAVASLDHPHIVKVYEVGECVRAGGETVPFVALEFVAGGSLGKRLRKEALEPAEAARLVRLLAKAMHHAHQRGVVHRDLKPDNVLLADAADEPALNMSLGCPKITDFGLARQKNSANRLTRSGAIVGTPAYMAPEQADGLPDVGPPADVWALGAILYRLLTGSQPFGGESYIDVLYKVRHHTPSSIRAVRPAVPPELEAVCLRCLEKDPAKRPTAAELASLLGGEAVARRRPIAVPWRWLAGAAVVLLVVIAFFAMPRGRDMAPAVEPVAVEPIALECKSLIVRTWDEKRHPKGQVGFHDSAVPVRENYAVAVEAELNQEAYMFLLLIDGQGVVTPLYPWNQDKIVVTSASARPPTVRASALRDPAAGGKSRSFDSTVGLETILLLVRRDPLPASVDIGTLLGRVPPAPLREHGEVVMRGWLRGRVMPEVRQELHRGVTKEALEIDEQLERVAARLADEFELIRAVQFAHVAGAK